MALAVHIKIRAVRRLDHGQRAARRVIAVRRKLVRDKVRYAENVFHDFIGMCKHKAVDALQDVIAAGAANEISVVDVSAAVRLDGQNFAAERVCRGGLLV